MSLTIAFQKQILEEYACPNCLPAPTHSTDDGISRTFFVLPGFLVMMEEVAFGRVEVIVI